MLNQLIKAAPESGVERPQPSEGVELGSTPQRELQNFICAVISMLGPTADCFLTEIWLDELSCMETIPEANSSDWQMVSLAASTRLASRLIEAQLRRTCI